MSLINVVHLRNKIHKNQNASKIAEIHKKFIILTAHKGPRILFMKNVNFSDFCAFWGHIISEIFLFFFSTKEYQSVS